MGCDGDLVKCLVFWTNLFLALIGICLLSVGIIYKVNLEELYYIIPSEYQRITVIPVLLIPIGTTLIALAVIGCYGTLMDRIRFVVMQSIILVFIIIIQISVGGNAFYEVRDTEEFSHKLNYTLDRAFKNYERHEYKEVVDVIQHKLKCCGINGSSYWNVVPKSCYRRDLMDGVKVLPACPAHVENYLIESVHVLGISSIVFATTEVIGAMISCYFANFLRNQSRRFIFMKSFPFDNEIL